MLEGEGSEEENFLARSDLCSEGWEFIKEKKKVRKHALVQEKENLLKKKELAQEYTISTEKRPRKRSRKKKLFFVLVRFLGRERDFLSEFFFS